MSTGAKVAVTAILIVVFFFVGAILLESGGSKTFVGLIALGLFYGVRSMFRSSEESDTQEVALDKSKSVDTPSNAAPRDES